MPIYESLNNDEEKVYRSDKNWKLNLGFKLFNTFLLFFITIFLILNYTAFTEMIYTLKHINLLNNSDFNQLLTIVKELDECVIRSHVCG
jgi:hypothetical protein